MTLRLSLLALVFITACSSTSGSGAATGDVATPNTDAEADGADTDDTGLEAVSDGGTYVGRVNGLSSGMKLGETASASLVIALASGGAADGITVEASFIHQGMGHGGPKAPTLTGGVAGAFAVADIVPSMAGTWELRLEVTGAAGTETITFEVIVTP
jgi:hypothetical protein